MKSGAKQLVMLFEDKQEVSGLAEQTQRELVATLADLLLHAVNACCEGDSDEPEDLR